jgi:nucleoside 2-deoxyribosyltransferase
MLNVVGGTYREICNESNWNQLYGSGLRAALACADLGRKVRLHTYATNEITSDLIAYSEPYGVECRITPSDVAVEFRYAHPLAIPQITPFPGEIPKQVTISVTGRSILRFGMLDGDAKVTGTRVVYDPQNVRSPEHFAANGSTADHLAVVLNLKEAFVLSGETTTIRAARMLQRKGADVVVIKDGARGAHVFDRGERFDVPSFHTDYVWPIGSGDVFAALFAYYWGEKEAKAKTAALKASWGTASFVSSRALPIQRQIYARLPGYKRAARNAPRRGTLRVYLAGPFFTIAQRWLIEETRSALVGIGLDVFSPFHDVGLGPANKVVAQDLKNLDEADVVLALVDGTDSGTLFEIGYARKANTPVVVLAENEGEQPMKMLDGSNCVVKADFASAIYAAWWAACGSEAPLPYTFP